MSQTLVTTVSGGYNGGATITSMLDDTQVFTSTANDTYNFNYNNLSGSFESVAGTVYITVTPPANQNAQLAIVYSGAIDRSLSISPNGSNTSWGYNFSDSYTIEEPEPEPVPFETMSLVLSVNNSERQAINKNLSDSVTLNGTLRSETSVINPSILVQISNPSGYNYAYIPEFGRYYFISNMTNIRTGLWRLDMSVDVLMSFKDAILNLDVIVSDDSGFDQERYMSGNQWQTTVKTKTDIINFPNGLLESGQYILITAGGEGSV